MGGLKFYELLGSESEWYEQKLGICPKYGLIVTQNPFTPEQLERRYKKESKFEYDKATYLGGLKEDYVVQSQR